MVIKKIIMNQIKGIKSVKSDRSFFRDMANYLSQITVSFRKNPKRLSPVQASLQASSLQAYTHAQTKGHGKVHVNIALNYLKLIYCLHKQ